MKQILQMLLDQKINLFLQFENTYYTLKFFYLT